MNDYEKLLTKMRKQKHQLRILINKITDYKQEIEKLQNILDNVGYQIEGIIRTTEEFGISKNTGEVLSKHNIELLKKILKMIVNKDVSIRSDK